MNDLVRFGVSIEKELLDKFDILIDQKGYTNRSEALRDLIRDSLAQKDQEDKTKESTGTISIVYDHHTHELTHKLTAIQHDYHELINSTIHIHLDHHNCLEVIVVKGPIARLESLANNLASVKGVKTGKLTLAI
ncbi:MAG: nickel-responsive transcriptional regulator NikR [Candidatus Margulisiibacteriota bacterium]|nr:MAG: nickel-responsive regulator [Candidatus Margulisbacteria bacterium GWD2_39_127]OGI03229.1 MAG: nickel-responsive regulator [Candidatus Margulisbacteria bacterium GWF2_38_17]OGI11252.1 MAG: nickel-responsive regulator [Candidatus Margulisbacteria bacterium GWE2_39_32]PZM78529.1 MAG: nickel-responsive transcriptional regulator NikR [Candidatus Margulisiibacteriota bacterium]HAR63905.1 nickel-responsive transcriptional regulator NikR [Candidatus Margulisiibacteriota bacterium]